MCKRGLIGLEYCVQVEKHNLEKYLSTLKENILKEISCSIIIEIHKKHKKKKYIKKVKEKMRGKLERKCEVKDHGIGLTKTN